MPETMLYRCSKSAGNVIFFTLAFIHFAFHWQYSSTMVGFGRSKQLLLYTLYINVSRYLARDKTLKRDNNFSMSVNLEEIQLIE